MLAETTMGFAFPSPATAAGFGMHTARPFLICMGLVVYTNTESGPESSVGSTALEPALNRNHLALCSRCSALLIEYEISSFRQEIQLSLISHL